MPNLGLQRTYNVPDPDGTVGKIFFRDPTTDEREKFQAELVEITTAKTTNGERPKPVTALCMQYGGMLITGAEGWTVPEGMDQVKALREFAGDLVSELGHQVFLRMSGRKLELGKSES